MSLPAVQALGRKVCMSDDPSLSIDAARVVITQTGGKTLMAAIDFARGSLDKPLTDRELEVKLMALCRYGRSGCAAEPLIDAVWALERRHGAYVANCTHERGVSSRLRPPRFALPSPSPGGRRERRVPARAGRFMGRAHDAGALMVLAQGAAR